MELFNKWILSPIFNKKFNKEEFEHDLREELESNQDFAVFYNKHKFKKRQDLSRVDDDKIISYFLDGVLINKINALFAPRVIFRDYLNGNNPHYLITKNQPFPLNLLEAAYQINESYLCFYYIVIENMMKFCEEYNLNKNFDNDSILEILDSVFYSIYNTYLEYIIIITKNYKPFDNPAVFMYLGEILIKRIDIYMNGRIKGDFCDRYGFNCEAMKGVEFIG